MNPQTTKHFAITVHYGRPDVTARAVQSLIQNSNPPDHIIVINHSSSALSLQPHPRLLQINPLVNSGYAAGINMGLGTITKLRARPGDIVTCFNNDVLFLTDTFTKLRQWWIRHPGNALLGLTVTAAHQPQYRSGRINLLTGRSRLTSQPYPDHPRHFSFTLPYIHGACYSAPVDLLLSNHGLPSAYFMYWEDALFSRQIARRHLPIKTAADIVVNHADGPAASTDKKTYYLVRNGALFLEQETPWPWRYYWWVLNRLRYAYHRLRRRQPIVIKALADAIHRTTAAIAS